MHRVRNGDRGGDSFDGWLRIEKPHAADLGVARKPSFTIPLRTGAVGEVRERDARGREISRPIVVAVWRLPTSSNLAGY